MCLKQRMRTRDFFHKVKQHFYRTLSNGLPKLESKELRKLPAVPISQTKTASIVADSSIQDLPHGRHSPAHRHSKLRPIVDESYSPAKIAGTCVGITCKAEHKLPERIDREFEPQEDSPVSSAQQFACQVGCDLTRLDKLSAPLPCYCATAQLQQLRERHHVHRQSMIHLAGLIRDMGSKVFGVGPQHLRVFWEDSDLIAFNRNGALFFNAHRFEIQKHAGNPTDATNYWFGEHYIYFLW
jgi:hypothetical protein